MSLVDLRGRTIELRAEITHLDNMLDQADTELRARLQILVEDPASNDAGLNYQTQRLHVGVLDHIITQRLDDLRAVLEEMRPLIADLQRTDDMQRLQRPQLRRSPRLHN